ncbi:hypothetical protein ACOME3_004260 [Neoechinorhynchus agilis]
MSGKIRHQLSAYMDLWELKADPSDSSVKEMDDLVSAHKKLVEAGDPAGLTDRELFCVLKGIGKDCGSVTATTRKLCERRVNKYLDEAIKSKVKSTEKTSMSQSVTHKDAGHIVER